MALALRRPPGILQVALLRICFEQMHLLHASRSLGSNESESGLLESFFLRLWIVMLVKPKAKVTDAARIYRADPHDGEIKNQRF
jgi:hypothetical protein